MASFNQRSTSAMGMGTGTGEKTYFEQQREALLRDIAVSFEHVLANINKLNRSLEAVIAVGNEFSSVEALWSQFENVMDKGDDNNNNNNNNNNTKQQPQQQQQQQVGETSTLSGNQQARRRRDSDDPDVKMEEA